MQLDEDLKQYEAVLLNGCAVLGAAHLGFLLTLENENKLRFLKVLSGTSIGSIVGLFFLAKIPLSNVASIFRNESLAGLMQPLDSMADMVDNLGFARSDGVLNLIRDVLAKHGVDWKTLTFKHLKSIGRNVDFLVVTSRYVGGREKFVPAYFTTQSHGDMLVLDAIRLSINIPFLFTATSYQNERYVDGVLTDELPFDYIHEKYGIESEYMLAHAPFVVNNAYDTAPQWWSHLVSLLEYTIDRIRQKKRYKERILLTELSGNGTLLQMQATSPLIDYFIITGIMSTRRFLSINNPTHNRPASH